MNFFDKMDHIMKNNNKIKVFLDMDGTIVENVFDSINSFSQKGGYIKKEPIKPIIEKINFLKEKYTDIEINILSCSKNEDMVQEKNVWLDMYMPYVEKQNRIFLVKEKGEYNRENIHRVKGEYIKNTITSNEIAILIDDDNETLREAQKALDNKVIPIHVTSLLI